MKKIMAALLSGVLCLATFTGCGQPVKDSGSAKEVSTPTDTNGSKEQVLNLALSTGDGFTTDDKIATPWSNRSMATNLMFRSLFIADSTLTEVSPDLAKSYTISDDSLTYTIVLKDNLKWSDGVPLTVDDVVFSIETASKAAVINAIYTSAFGYIQELSAQDGTITIQLSEPNSTLIDVLGQFAILPKHKLEQVDPLSLDSDAFWKNPVTSGMFTLDEFNTGNYFTLKLNEHYEGTAPKITKVNAYFVSDTLTAAMSGKAHIVDGNAADFVDQLIASNQFDAHEVDILFYRYFLFNMEGVDGEQNPAMQNPAVRKALMKAIDREALSGLYPNANIINSGVPDTHEAYNGFYYEYNPEEAKKELLASGYDMNRPIRICYYHNDQTSVDLINTVVYYLEQIGLKVEATLSNDGTTDLFTTRNYDMGLKGKASFAIYEWYTEYLSTDALFRNVYGGDTTFDEPIARLLAATDRNEQNQVLKELQALEQDLSYKVNLFTLGTYIFTSKELNLPSGVAFSNPRYSSDISFEEWEIR